MGSPFHQRGSLTWAENVLNVALISASKNSPDIMPCDSGYNPFRKAHPFKNKWSFSLDQTELRWQWNTNWAAFESDKQASCTDCWLRFEPDIAVSGQLAELYFSTLLAARGSDILAGIHPELSVWQVALHLTRIHDTLYLIRPTCIPRWWLRPPTRKISLEF